jgi:tetratricopeptide (TPR) repeat protein
MANTSPIDFTVTFAEAYHNLALAGAEMRTATNALETIREALAGNKSFFEIAFVIDDQIGRANVKRLAPVLVNLRKTIIDQLTEKEVRRLQESFDRDPAKGWQTWLMTYAESFSEFSWYTHFARVIARRSLSYTPDGAPSVEKVRQYVDFAFYRRWPEVYDWFLFLSRQQLPAVHRARMLGTAAEIQLYHFYHPTQAKALLEQAQELVREDDRISQIWGEYYLENDQPEKAREYFELIISHKPYVSSFFVNLGDYYARTNNLNAAETQYEQAVQNSPGMMDGYRALMDLFTKLPSVQDLESRLQTLMEKLQLIASEPDLPLVWYYLGDTHQKLKNFSQAADSYQKSITLDPDWLDSYVSLAYLYLDQAKEEKDESRLQEYDDLTRQTFLKVQKQAPTAMDSYRGLMTLALAQKKYEEAYKWMEKASRACHTEWASYIDGTKGELIRRTGNLKRAEKLFMRSLKAEPINPSVVSYLDYLADDYESKDATACQRILKLWRELSGEAVEYTYQNRLGNVWYYNADYARAVEHYRKAIAVNSTRHVLYSNLALALEKMNTPGKCIAEVEEAIAALSRAIELDPDEAEYPPRLQTLETKRSFLSTYGEHVLSYELAAVAIRVSFDQDLLPHILNTSQDGLSEETLNKIDALRTRIQDERGILVPGMIFSELTENDLPSGTYRIEIMDQEVETAQVDASKPDALDAILGQAQILLQSRLASFVTFQETCKLVDACGSEDCKSIRNSTASMILLEQVIKAMLERGMSIKEFDRIVAEVLRPGKAGKVGKAGSSKDSIIQRLSARSAEKQEPAVA